MLSTGRLLALFFVAAFKKNSRKRRAIIFNNAITIRGRCLSCKIPTAGKTLGHSGKWDANIQDYLFLKIPESNNNTSTHGSEQCMKWSVCYCLQGALGSPAKGPVQTKHDAGDRSATWGCSRPPSLLHSVLQKQRLTVWQPLLEPSQVKALRRKETTSRFSLLSKGSWSGWWQFVNEDTSWWCFVIKFVCQVSTPSLSWPWELLFMGWKFWRNFSYGAAAAAAMHPMHHWVHPVSVSWLPSSVKP